jgi:3-deoxy-D-manno-octulosonic-acid transferase
VLAHSGAALAALVAAPAALPLLALRPDLRAGLRDRLGAPRDVAPGAIWIHGASVGEAVAALPLHRLLQERGYRTLASTMTRTGQLALERRRPELARLFAPIDHPWCVGAALRRVRPRALVLVETELWPSWIAAAARRGIPVAVVSARLSDRSFPRYRSLAFAVAPTLRRLTRIGARSAADAERFVALGAASERVDVTGDLKLEPPSDPPVLAPDLDAALGQVTWLVAGSTHPGEEEAALRALAAAEQAGHDIGLVLAPRHPERAREAARIAAGQGRRVQLRTDLAARALQHGDVLVLDTVGELPALYSRAAVCFVGGSLVPIGGHNVLEPVQVGRTVLFGRHTSSARDAVELVLACGAGRRVTGAEGLARAVVEELGEPDVAARRGRMGRQVLDEHSGAARRSAALIEGLLAGSGSS